MQKPIALLLEGPGDHQRLLAALCAAQGFAVRIAPDVAEARHCAQREQPAVACLSLELIESQDGMDLLADDTLESAYEIFVVGDADYSAMADRAVGMGASFYFCRPVDGAYLSELLGELADETRADGQGTNGGEPCLDQFGLLRGNSRPMRRLYRVLRRVAGTDAQVLITGESGVGKELVARSLHLLSERRDGPFVAVNCGAVPGELMESELFGHEKGAFTGATRAHDGYFDQANGGTLFLDEITEMDPRLQVKLLRVLESRRYRRVGAERERCTDVRILSTSNQLPEQAVRDQNLREDLYFRLARFSVRVPALRERGNDIPALAKQFLLTLNDAHGTAKRFSERALTQLRAHDWPGNVRELKYAVEHAYIMGGERIETEDLPEALSRGIANCAQPPRIRVGMSLAEAERRLIDATLEHFGGDKAATAKTLGISLKTLYNRLHRYAATEDHAPAQHRGRRAAHA